MSIGYSKHKPNKETCSLADIGLRSDSTCELKNGISENCSESEFQSIRQCYTEIDTYEALRPVF